MIEPDKVEVTQGRVYYRAETQWEEQTLFANGFHRSPRGDGWFEAPESSAAESAARTIEQGGIG